MWAARLLGFAALASLGALQWQRLVEGLSSGRALLWVAAATAAGAAILACDRLPARGRGPGTLAVTAAALFAAVVVSGLPLDLLRPRNWDVLIDGVTSGAQSLGTVRLPYAGTDAWPRVTLELTGSLLLTLSAMVACWPRPHTRGYPFLALAALLVMVVSPVVSLGGARPLILGAAIAALTVCFLWLERLPLRPGLGVAALLGVALAGALPLAAVADRGEPWFDYKAFAEGLGPDDPVRFSWAQQYGPIDWPRDGNEVMRVKSDEPHYWKVVNLNRFDGIGFSDAGPRDRGGDDAESELRDDWRNKPGWLDTVEVTVRRMRTRDVPAPGTIMEVEEGTREMRPSGEPGRWTAPTELRRGDSYTVDAYVPAPTPVELQQADRTGFRASRTDELAITVPFEPGRAPRIRKVGGVGSGRVDSAVVHFRPFGDDGKPFVTYPTIRRTRYDAGEQTLRRTPYRRTWELAKRMRAAADTPFEYILLVNNYLQQGFGYSERPDAPPGRTRPARRVPVRHQGGLLPALLGRDGTAAAHGRRAGAGRDRLQPRRLLEAARCLDRARLRRARVGRGVVRRDRLGHVRPDAGADTGALADRRAGVADGGRGGAGR